MAIWDPLVSRFKYRNSDTSNNPFGEFLKETINKGGPNAAHALVVKDIFDKFNNNTPEPSWLSSSAINKAANSNVAYSAGGFVGVNDYSVKGRRQWAAERRRYSSSQ